MEAFVCQHAAAAGAMAFVLGSIVGSFLNVCAYRIPLEQSIVRPGSRCPSCERPIPWQLNLPVISWLWLRGRAVCCGARIPARYWVVEALTGSAFAYALLTFGDGPHPEKAFAVALFATLLIGSAVTDLESMIIPDRFSVGGACLGVVLAFTFPALRLSQDLGLASDHWRSGVDALLGALVGSSSIYWIGLLAEKALRRDAMGEGDVKLLGCIGAFCGWQGAIFSIFGGAVVGACVLIPLTLLRGRGKASADVGEDGSPALWGVEVPFGPFLAMVALVYYMGLDVPVDAWFEKVRFILGYGFPPDLPGFEFLR